MAHPDAQETIRQLDDEALLAKFVPTNVNFIVAGLLAGKFQEPKYSELRDELYSIDLEIRRRGLFRTPKHKAALKTAHEQAWQLLRLNGRQSSSKSDVDALQVDRESVEIFADRKNDPPAVPTSAAPAREDDPSPASTSAAPGWTIIAGWRHAIFALGHGRSADE